jgi:predicted TIM-barrel fold metal-dependent hydrolase
VSDPLVVDVHVHVFEHAGDPMRDGYEIWEYGEMSDVAYGDRDGTFDDLETAMSEQSCDHSVILGMFVPSIERATGSSDLPERMRQYNQWVLTTAGRSPRLTPLIAADPTVLGGKDGADHLALAAEKGAKGIKIHPVLQEFFPDDPRMDATYSLCEERGLTVLSHSGRTKESAQWADPFAFASVMEHHPRLHLLLAHLGGASWSHVSEFAAAFPTVSFDLCEIIAWTGSPGAPTADQLGRMIRDIGAERVLFGTDFPWYELDRTIDQLMSLPHLSDEERQGILGANAVRRMGLSIAGPVN